MHSPGPATLPPSRLAPEATAETLAEQIQHGQLLALAPDYSGCAMAVVFSLISQRKKALRLVGVPQMGLQADLLIGAGCVSAVDAAAVTLGEAGQAPRFVEAVVQRSIDMRDSTCPVIHAGLQAAEKGIPFMPLRGVLGSDLLRHRADWQVIDNPFASDSASADTQAAEDAEAMRDPILLVPAINPDIALFHAPLADVHGNVWVGVRRELMLMAHAAKCSLVTVEKVVEHNLLSDPAMAAGVIPALYISSLACVPQGAAPLGLFGCYDADTVLLQRYADKARSEQGFQQMLAELLGD